MTKVSLAGSIQIDVPVKPVWPNEPSGKTSPRGEEYCESISQPRPRRAGTHGGDCGEIIFSIEACDKIRRPPLLETVPPFSTMVQNFARSAAVEKTPALPATPP